jgi:hypothetical protein
MYILTTLLHQKNENKLSLLYHYIKIFLIQILYKNIFDTNIIMFKLYLSTLLITPFLIYIYNKNKKKNKRIYWSKKLVTHYKIINNNIKKINCNKNN